MYLKMLKNLGCNITISDCKKTIINEVCVAGVLEDSQKNKICECTGIGKTKKEAETNLYKNMLNRVVNEIDFNKCLSFSNDVSFNAFSHYDDYMNIPVFNKYLNYFCGGNETIIKNYLNLINNGDSYKANRYSSLHTDELKLIDDKLMCRCLDDLYAGIGEDKEEVIVDILYKLINSYVNSVFYSNLRMCKIINEKTFPDKIKKLIKQTEKNNIDCVLVDCSGIIETPTVALITIDKTNHITNVITDTNLNIENAMYNCFSKRLAMNIDYEPPIPFLDVNADSLYIEGLFKNANCFPETLFINSNKINYDEIKVFENNDLFSKFNIYRFCKNIDGLYAVRLYVDNLELLNNIEFYIPKDEIDFELLNNQIDLLHRYINENDDEQKLIILNSINIDKELIPFLGSVNQLSAEPEFRQNYRDLFCNPVQNVKQIRNCLCNKQKAIFDVYLYEYNYSNEQKYTSDYKNEISNILGYENTLQNSCVADPQIAFLHLFVQLYTLHVKDGLKSILVHLARCS